MEERKFDSIFRNKLSGMSEEYNPADWVTMEHLLNQQEPGNELVDDADFDEVFFDKLSNVNATYNENHWNLLAKRLDKELYLPAPVVKYKVLELFLVVFFLLTFWVIIPEKTNLPIFDQLDLRSNESAIIDQETNVKPLQSLAAKKSDINKNVDATETVVSEAIAVVVNQSDIVAENEGSLLTAQNDVYHYGLNSDNFNNLIQERVVDFSSTDILDRSSNTPIEEVPPLMTNIDYKAEKEGESSISQINNLKETRERKIGIYVGIVGATEYNEIVTPFDPLYEVESQSLWNTGYGGGMSLGFRYRNWELETGALYRSNEYQPREIIEINDAASANGAYVASTLNKIDMEVVRVPLNFKYNVNLWDKWKVYALSGVGLNLVVDADYGKETYLLGAKTSSSFSSTPRSSVLSQKEFTPGILNGGSFSDNSYLTANLGLGVERQLAKNWSFLLQPTYQKQIFTSGFGPNNDKFNAFSVQTGFRFKIK